MSVKIKAKILYCVFIGRLRTEEVIKNIMSTP